jgi:hypothetical protein
MLNTCETTLTQLKGAIPKLSNIVDLMSQVAGIWRVMKSNLDLIKERESLW